MNAILIYTVIKFLMKHILRIYIILGMTKLRFIKGNLKILKDIGYFADIILQYAY